MLVGVGAWVPGQPGQAVESWVENQKSRADFNNLRGDLQKVTFQKTMCYPPHAHMSRGYKANWFAKSDSSTEVYVTRCHLLECISVDKLLLPLKGRMC